MPDEIAATFEFHVGVTELRDSLGFTVQEVARSGNPAIVHRYGQAHAARPALGMAVAKTIGTADLQLFDGSAVTARRFRLPGTD